MSLTDENIWNLPPTRELPYQRGRRPGALRYTWAGPFNSQLFDNKLTDLSSQTKSNLMKLATKIAQTDSCSQYGIKHWHSDSRSASAMSKFSESKESQFQGSWSNISVMFSSGNALDCFSHLHTTDDDKSDDSSLSKVPMNFCYLCSTLEEHQKAHLRKSLLRDRPRQKMPRVCYIAPLPKVRKKREEVQLVHDALYKVTIWTGDVPGASTDANVSITIVGDQDHLSKTRLMKKQSTVKFCFVSGSKDVFYIKAPKLGNLQYVTIEHDGLEKKHAWYLDKLEVKCMYTNRVWLFSCNNWLSMHHADFTIKRDLKALEKEMIFVVYEVTIFTGKKQMSGTDANVYLTLHGKDGWSSKMHLNTLNQGKCFQRHSKDVFRFRILDIGEITSLRVEHDGSGIASGWYLEKIIVKDITPSHGGVVYYFVYNGWIAKDVGEGYLWRELRAKKHLPNEVTSAPRRSHIKERVKEKRASVQYEVVVKTGDVRYAGTDANVYIIFVGSQGKSAKLFMDDSRNNFERGSTESFKLQAMNVGTLQNIILGHDNSGPGAGWFCDHVKVRKYFLPQEIKEKLYQQKKLWKATKQKQKDALKPKRQDDNTSQSDSDSELNTSQTSSRARDEHQGSTKKLLDEMFDKDGKVVSVPLYEEYFFPCSKWFASDEGDGLIERELQLEKKTTFFQER